MKTFIIAEAGVNHNGSLSSAIEMVKVARNCGADAVKFQTFIAEEEISKFAPKASYQKKTTNKNETQLDMVKKLELNKKDHIKILNECDKQGIEFMSSPFDIKSVELLKELKLKRFKVPSGEITNLPLLEKIGGAGKPVIISTGMSNIKEIDEAINILTENGVKRKKISILHCNTEYPTPMRDVNLLAINTLSKRYNLQIGYSDHTKGIEVSIAAVALGAQIIEKHFTLDKSLPGPDHSSSLEPDELKRMVNSIRNIESSFGDGIKKPTLSEKKNIDIARKSIVAKKNIKKNEIFSENNITTKRPGNGISPMRWHYYLGKRSNRNYKKDELIQ